MHDPIPSRLALLLVVIACFLLPACSHTESPEQPSSTPDRERIAAAIAGYAEVISDFDQLRAIVVATDDRIVFEQYYGTDQEAYWGVQSVTKSVVSTLIGIALHEGLIGSLDDTLAQLLPRYADVMSAKVAGTTLRLLLTMTAGFPSGEEAAGPAFTQSEDWVREILTHPESPPGNRFLYSNGTSHLLAALLEEATGTSALEYARSRLFGPLRIDTRPAFRGAGTQGTLAEYWAAYENAGFAWPVDPQGVSTGWWGIKLRPRDMVKLGQLFLAGGRWGNQQVVPADWADLATTKQVAADGLAEGYGYQWWTSTVDGDEAFAALGYGGQVIQVVPDRNVVVVTSTELRPSDATSHGIDINLLLNVIEDDIISQLPAD
jgi:CubicO group peptidase (beta-lactamase class C family)